MKSSSLINNTKKCDNFGNWSRYLRHISAVSFRFRSPQLHRFNKVISQYMTNSQNVSQLTSGYNPGHPGSKILLRFKEQRRTVHISLSSKAVRTRLYARASRASWHVRMQLVTWHIHMHTHTHTHTKVQFGIKRFCYTICSSFVFCNYTTATMLASLGAKLSLRIPTRLRTFPRIHGIMRRILVPNRQFEFRREKGQRKLKLRTLLSAGICGLL